MGLESELKAARAESEKKEAEAGRRRRDNEALREELAAAKAAARAAGGGVVPSMAPAPPEASPAASAHANDGPGASTSEHEMVFVVAEALPRIVPNVLIQKREELLPVLVCAIKHHPQLAVREALTGQLFNLVKKPTDAQARFDEALLRSPL